MTQGKERAEKIVPQRGQQVYRPCWQWLQSSVCTVRCGVVGVGGMPWRDEKAGHVRLENQGISKAQMPRGSRVMGSTREREKERD